MLRLKLVYCAFIIIIYYDDNYDIIKNIFKISK